jgi:putative acetyltransferase
MIIRNAEASDLGAVLAVERAAFSSNKEARLVETLMDDPSARPAFSLLAFREDRAVGHILFTRAALAGAPELSAAILAHLSVIPEAQRQGLGAALIRHEMQLLAKYGIDLVFVLGYPEYYPRHGFQPAGRFGFASPTPIREKDSAAWMVHELRPDVIGKYSGMVLCAKKLDRPAYWRE